MARKRWPRHMLPRPMGRPPYPVHIGAINQTRIREDLCLTSYPDVDQLFDDIMTKCPEYFAYRIERHRIRASGAAPSREIPSFEVVQKLANSGRDAVTSASPDWSSLTLPDLVARLIRAIDILIRPERRISAGEAATTNKSKIPIDLKLSQEKPSSYRDIYIWRLRALINAKFGKGHDWYVGPGRRQGKYKKRILDFTKNWRRTRAPDWDIRHWIVSGDCSARKSSPGHSEAADRDATDVSMDEDESDHGDQPSVRSSSRTMHFPWLPGSEAPSGAPATPISPDTSAPEQSPGNAGDTPTEDDLESFDVEVAVDDAMASLREGLQEVHQSYRPDTADFFRLVESGSKRSREPQIRPTVLEHMERLRTLTPEVRGIPALDALYFNIQQRIDTLNRVKTAMRSVLERYADKEALEVCQLHEQSIDIASQLQQHLETATSSLNEIREKERDRLEQEQRRREEEEWLRKEEEERWRDPFYAFNLVAADNCYAGLSPDGSELDDAEEFDEESDDMVILNPRNFRVQSSME